MSNDDVYNVVISVAEGSREVEEIAEDLERVIASELT